MFINLSFKTKILIIIVIILSSPTVNAVNNNTYSYEMEVGEHISIIENQLDMFYSGQIKGYNFAASLDLSKKERFLDGIRRSEDIEYDDYFLSLFKDRTKLKLGLVDARNNISSLSSDQLLGVYLNRGNYELWLGNTIKRSVGLSSQSDFQWGISYSNYHKNITLQSIKEKDSYNHFLAYRDSLISKAGRVFWKLDAGFNQKDQLYGISNKLGFSSEINDINYIISGTYTTPDFSALESENDIGYGNYYFNLSANKRINSVLINSDFNYRRNNLNQELDETTHDYYTSLNFNYYPSYKTNYYLDLNYNTQLSYSTNDNGIIDRLDDFKVELGREKGDLSTNISYDLSKDTVKDKEAILEIDYFPADYRIRGQYLWSEEEGWESELEFSYDYEKELNSKLNYESEVEFIKDRDKTITWNQELFYRISKQKRVTLDLNLSKNLSFAGVERLLVLHYKQQF